MQKNIYVGGILGTCTFKAVTKPFIELPDELFSVRAKIRFDDFKLIKNIEEYVNKK